MGQAVTERARAILELVPTMRRRNAKGDEGLRPVPDSRFGDSIIQLDIALKN